MKSETFIKQKASNSIKDAVIVNWVIANERLPERIKYHKFSEEVILTDGVKVYAGYYGYGINKWCSNSVDEKRNVIAWMPMPMPYTNSK